MSTIHIYYFNATLVSD